MEQQGDILKRGVERQSRGRRWIRNFVVAGLAATVGVIIAAYWLSSAKKHAGWTQRSELPNNINQQLSGFTFTRSEGGRQLFRIHAARTTAFKEGGGTVLEDVYVEFFGRSGKRYDLLRTAEGDYKPATGDLSTPGQVELTLNASPEQIQGVTASNGAPESKAPPAAPSRRQPVFIRTSEVTSQDHGTLMESNAAVHFNLGRVSGSALGLIYATGRDQIVLKSDVKAVFRPAPTPHTENPIQLSADRLLYDGVGEEAQLLGPVEIRQGNRVIRAEQGAILFDRENRIRTIVLKGQAYASDQTRNSEASLRADQMTGTLDPESNRLTKLLATGHVVGRSRQVGGVTRFQGDEVELNLPGPRYVPATGEAIGKVQMRFAQTAGSVGRASHTATFDGRISQGELTSEKIRFSFRAGGKNLQKAETLGPGKLVLIPQDPQSGQRIASAAKFSMTFDSRSRLESLQGSGGTQIAYVPSPGASNPRSAVSVASQMVAHFDPSTETLRSIDQKGDFHFQSADLQAKAEEAHDSARAQEVVLSGHPEVWDATTRARADRVVLRLDSEIAEGFGGVHAVQFSPQDHASLPTNVVADHMLADRKSQVVHYEGHVRAWRGTDVVESSSLDVYKRQGRVSSGTRVVTSHLQPAPAPEKKGAKKAGGSGPQPLTIHADHLEYFDEGRRAHYSGHVQLVTENTQLRADGLDVYFSNSRAFKNSQIDRAVAEGHVEVTQPMRYAKGEHAVYDARTGRIVMTGGPPALYDAERGFTSGQRLTFYIHDDRLLIDGGTNSPTVSKHRVAH